MTIPINKQNNEKFKLKILFLFELSFLPTSRLFREDATRVCESAKISAGPGVLQSNKSGGPTRVLSDLLKYVTFQKLHKNACS